VCPFAPHSADFWPRRCHQKTRYDACKNTIIGISLAVHTNVIVTLTNVVMALINCTTALTNRAMALVNGIRTDNSVAVLVNGPSHLQLHSQPSPGASNSISMAKAISAPIRQPDSSAVDPFFLKGTTHSSFHHILSNLFSFSHSKMVVESPTAMLWPFTCQPFYHSSFPTTTSRLPFNLPSFRTMSR